MVINIEFTKPNKKFQPLSWAIRKFQKTPYSHVRLSWVSKSGEKLIYEASGTEVKLIGKEASPKHPVHIMKTYHVKLNSLEYSKMIRLFRYAGVSYGKNQLIGICLVTIFNLKVNPFARGSKSQVCSELLGLFLQEVKEWGNNLDLDVAGPKEIEKTLIKLVEKYPEEIYTLV